MVSFKEVWPFSSKEKKKRENQDKQDKQSSTRGAQRDAPQASINGSAHAPTTTASPQQLSLDLSKLNFQQDTNAALNKDSNGVANTSLTDNSSRFIPLYPGRDPYNESIASRNIASVPDDHQRSIASIRSEQKDRQPQSPTRRTAQTSQTSSPTSPRRANGAAASHHLQHYPSHADLRSSLDSSRDKPLRARASNDTFHTPRPVPLQKQHLQQQADLSHTRASLDKPLPSDPPSTAPQKSSLQTIPSASTIVARAHANAISPSHYTAVHETHAPAVTHETIQTQTHEIHTDLITREVHTHEVHHRVLPVVDVQFRPTRHFVPGPGEPADGSGQLVELPADELPEHLRGSAEQAVEHLKREWKHGVPSGVGNEDLNGVAHDARNVSDSASFPQQRQQQEQTQQQRQQVPVPAPVQVAHHESVTSDGNFRAETTWVHAPVIQG